MNRLEKVKAVIKEDFQECGLFFTSGADEDGHITIFDEDGISVCVCHEWRYFDVFGLTNDEQKELLAWYEQEAKEVNSFDKSKEGTAMLSDEKMLRRTACALLGKSYNELSKDEYEKFINLLKEETEKRAKNFHWRTSDTMVPEYWKLPVFYPTIKHCDSDKDGKDVELNRNVSINK